MLSVRADGQPSEAPRHAGDVPMQWIGMATTIRTVFSLPLLRRWLDKMQYNLKNLAVPVALTPLDATDLGPVTAPDPKLPRPSHNYAVDRF
jgi:hypothetical protein